MIRLNEQIIEESSEFQYFRCTFYKPSSMEDETKEKESFTEKEGIRIFNGYDKKKDNEHGKNKK